MYLDGTHRNVLCAEARQDNRGAVVAKGVLENAVINSVRGWWHFVFTHGWKCLLSFVWIQLTEDIVSVLLLTS